MNSKRVILLFLATLSRLISIQSLSAESLDQQLSRVSIELKRVSSELKFAEIDIQVVIRLTKEPTLGSLKTQIFPNTDAGLYERYHRHFGGKGNSEPVNASELREIVTKNLVQLSEKVDALKDEKARLIREKEHEFQISLKREGDSALAEVLQQLLKKLENLNASNLQKSGLSTEQPGKQTSTHQTENAAETGSTVHQFKKE